MRQLGGHENIITITPKNIKGKKSKIQNDIEESKDQESMDIIQLSDTSNHYDGDENDVKPDTPKGQADKNNSELKDLTCIEKFFGNRWNTWMSKLKFFILPITLIWIGIALWRALSLESATEAIRRLPDDHWLVKLEDTLSDDFHRTAEAESLTVYLVWGISKLNRDGVDRWDPTDIGKIVYDDDFDMSSEAN